MTNHFIGITSTIPSEIVFAAGASPVDLNNVFITSSDPYGLVETAEKAGFPRNYCAWMKGIYGALQLRPDITTVIGVMQGDCGNTAALMDLLASEGREIIPFAYPAGAAGEPLRAELMSLARRLGTDLEEAEKQREALRRVRELAADIDSMTWKDGLIDGRENHLALVNMSDFKGDPSAYEQELTELRNRARRRKPRGTGPRLAFAGVPPISSDIYEAAEERGARVVYNEVQLEFAMTRPADDLTGQYACYTYPYGSLRRSVVIAKEIKARGADGLVHNVQSFCYHQLDDIVIRNAVDVPVLTLESDRPGPLDSRARLRLEAFIETLLG